MSQQEHQQSPSQSRLAKTSPRHQTLTIVNSTPSRSSSHRTRSSIHENNAADAAAAVPRANNRPSNPVNLLPLPSVTRPSQRSHTERLSSFPLPYMRTETLSSSSSSTATTGRDRKRNRALADIHRFDSTGERRPSVRRRLNFTSARSDSPPTTIEEPDHIQDFSDSDSDTEYVLVSDTNASNAAESEDLDETQIVENFQNEIDSIISEIGSTSSSSANNRTPDRPIRRNNRNITWAPLRNRNNEDDDIDNIHRRISPRTHAMWDFNSSDRANYHYPFEESSSVAIAGLQRMNRMANPIAQSTSENRSNANASEEPTSQSQTLHEEPSPPLIEQRQDNEEMSQPMTQSREQRPRRQRRRQSSSGSISNNNHVDQQRQQNNRNSDGDRNDILLRLIRHLDHSITETRNNMTTINNTETAMRNNASSAAATIDPLPTIVPPMSNINHNFDNFPTNATVCESVGSAHINISNTLQQIMLCIAGLQNVRSRMRTVSGGTNDIMHLFNDLVDIMKDAFSRSSMDLINITHNLASLVHAYNRFDTILDPLRNNVIDPNSAGDIESNEEIEEADDEWLMQDTQPRFPRMDNNGDFVAAEAANDETDGVRDEHSWIVGLPDRLMSLFQARDAVEARGIIDDIITIMFNNMSRTAQINNNSSVVQSNGDNEPPAEGGDSQTMINSLTGLRAMCNVIMGRNTVVWEGMVRFPDIGSLPDQPADDVNDPSSVCVICKTNRRNTVFVDCGHAAACLSCVHTLCDKSIREDEHHPKCPICRMTITAVMRINIP